VIAVTRGARLLGLLSVAAVVLTACGSSTPKTPTGGTALPRLAAPRAGIPSDYTSLAAMEKQLSGAARCTGNGPQSAVCSFLTTTTNGGQIASIQPFQLKVFRSTAAATQYASLVTETNRTRAATGVAERFLLAGPHWVAVPQITTPRSLETLLETYLGGTITS
jgi:hypothetical protein